MAYVFNDDKTKSVLSFATVASGSGTTIAAGATGYVDIDLSSYNPVVGVRAVRIDDTTQAAEKLITLGTYWNVNTLKVLVRNDNSSSVTVGTGNLKVFVNISYLA